MGGYGFLRETFSVSKFDGEKLSIYDMGRKKYSEITLCLKNCFCRKQNNVATTIFKNFAARQSQHKLTLQVKWVSPNEGHNRPLSVNLKPLAINIKPITLKTTRTSEKT